MTLTIPDDILQQAGISEREALLELAIRLFDTDRLGLSAAGRLAGMDRVHFEIELQSRGIAPYRPTVADVEHDVAALRNARPLP
jgi:predicted HTH domain antitoxin